MENATKHHEENNNQIVKTDSKITEKPSAQNSTKSPDSTNSKKENKYQAPSKVNVTQSGDAHKTDFTKHDSSPKPVIPLEVPIKPTKASKINDSQGSSSSEKSNSRPSIPKTSTKSYSTSTLNIETSSSVHIIEPTSSKPVVQSTAANINANSSNVTSASSTITLEPSKTIESESTAASSVPTPTESLPSTFTKTSPTAEKSIVHPTMNTFSKNSGTTFARLRVSYKYFSFDKTILHSVYNEFLARMQRTTMLD